MSEENNDDGGIDQQIEEQLALIEANLEKGCAFFAAKVKEAIPRRKKGKSTGTADKVKVKKTSRFYRTVSVPTPWNFNEFGTVHQAANPVVRRTLYANQEKIESIIAGNED